MVGLPLWRDGGILAYRVWYPIIETRRMYSERWGRLSNTTPAVSDATPLINELSLVNKTAFAPGNAILLMLSAITILMLRWAYAHDGVINNAAPNNSVKKKAGFLHMLSS